MFRALSTYRWVLFALAVVLVACSSATTAGAETGRTAKIGDLSLRLTLVAPNNTITAKQPVIARIEIANVASDGSEVVLPGITSLEIRDSEGKTLAKTPQPTSLEGIYSPARLNETTKTLEKVWVITGLYQFAQPGAYRIIVQQHARNEDWTVLAEDSAVLNVLPYDRAKLEAACNSLFQPLRKYTSRNTDLQMSVRVKALYWVNDEVVLPYLEWMAREWHDKSAYRALRAIGSQNAMTIVTTLAGENKEAEEAARKSEIAFTPDVYWKIDYY